MSVRIGTSGFHYAHWRGVFYPAGLPPSDWLRFYSREFDTVELNATFYRLPADTAIRRWRDQVPTGFIFSAKGSRYLTHLRKLADTGRGLDRFFSRITGLGPRKGPILWQLPPRWGVDPGRLASFLEALPGGYRHAFEFRDPSWHVREVFRLLERHGAALCAFHMGDHASPRVLTADFAYLRLHGPAGPYAGNYDDAALEAWASLVAGWARRVSAVFVYFNNDAYGHAVRNARRLKDLVGAYSPESSSRRISRP